MLYASFSVTGLRVLYIRNMTVPYELHPTVYAYTTNLNNFKFEIPVLHWNMALFCSILGSKEDFLIHFLKVTVLATVAGVSKFDGFTLLTLLKWK